MPPLFDFLKKAGKPPAVSQPAPATPAKAEAPAPAAAKTKQPPRLIDIGSPVILPEGVQFADVCLPEEAETSHFLIASTSLVEKTMAFTTLLDCLKDRGDVVIVVDADGEYLARYWFDETDGILNPADSRSKAPDLATGVPFVQHYLRHQSEGFLYLTYQGEPTPEQAAFIVGILDAAAKAAQNGELRSGTRVWLAIPDLDGLPQIPCLPSIVAQPATLRLALGLRKVAPASKAYGDEACAGMLAGLKNRLFLKSADGDTAAALTSLVPEDIVTEEGIGISPSLLARMPPGGMLLQVAGNKQLRAIKIPMPPRYDDAIAPFEAKRG